MYDNIFFVLEIVTNDILANEPNISISIITIKSKICC